ncbi:baseplate J/gp47 family protein [Marinisporobacter balticus]|uniref:Putative phage protein gp47/JayE n=1 Tax=Marinisporobacter balticus TaxID=2018667 RepID=A0A4V2SC48_9FIRM|nr:baseplate J/gp47 family protein [Marinisporobacter balticus]TCO78010.1 putative phage protein gp47/JayE [Marinisporobacter balticus]
MIENRETIQNRMLNSVSELYDKSQGSFFYDALKPVAIEIENMEKSIETVTKKLMMKNLKDLELEQRIHERTGIKRKPATKAAGYVTITGTKGAKVNENDLIASDTVNFIIKENKTIDDTGHVDVLVVCESYGVIGNVPAGSIQYFPVTLAGLKSATNKEAFKSGYDAEMDEELLQRYYERIQTPATSGNKYHYRNWAKEVTGVGDVKVISLPEDKPNTVKVIIIDSNKKPANPNLVEKVQNYIDPKIDSEEKVIWGCGEGKAPIGAFCTVVSANPVILDISFTLEEKDPSVPNDIMKKDIEDNITAYLRQIAFRENKVSYNKITSIILDSKGIVDFSEFTINGQKKNIPIGNADVPVLGGVNID